MMFNLWRVIIHHGCFYILPKEYSFQGYWQGGDSVASDRYCDFITTTCAFQRQNFHECNQHDNTVVAEFGSRLYHNMPHKALVLTVGDLPSNILRWEITSNVG